jgi:PhoH-like ATPase
MAKDKEKIFVLDTSVLINDPYVIDQLEDNKIVIPICVIEELDKLKHNKETAREASRIIDRYRNKASKHASLSRGVTTDAKGTLIVDITNADWTKLPSGMEESNDNNILLIAKKWQEEERGQEIIVLSADTNLRIKADAFGVDAQEYDHESVKVSNIGDLYSGYTDIILKPGPMDILTELARKKSLTAAEVANYFDITKLSPNQCCKLISGDSYLLAVLKKNGSLAGSEIRMIEKPKKEISEGRIQPINNEQAHAYHLLRDESVNLVTLVGMAGTGKTLLTLQAAIDQLGRYDQVLVYRPNIEIGTQIGYLPGDQEEKFRPWMQPIIDNLKLVMGQKGYKRGFGEEEKNGFGNFETLRDQNLLSIEPINFIRGRSLNNAFIFVDEAQNLTLHEVRTIITRAGKRTKVALVGDPYQIDSPFLTSTSNGLVVVVERFRGQNNFGHVTLIKGERSDLSEQAAKLLQ